MQCADVMTKDPVSIRASETVAVANRVMKTRNVGFLPVCDDSGAVIGFVTEQHLTRVVVEDDVGPATPVEQVMGRDVGKCALEDDVSVAERELAAHPGRCIVCVDDRGVPLGIIGVTDLARVGKRPSSA